MCLLITGCGIGDKGGESRSCKEVVCKHAARQSIFTHKYMNISMNNWLPDCEHDGSQRNRLSSLHCVL